MNKTQWAANILGIGLNITESELKKAYHKLCMQYHPDKNQGNEKAASRTMQDINTAYAIMTEYLQKNQSQTHQSFVRSVHNKPDIKIVKEDVRIVKEDVRVVKENVRIIRPNVRIMTMKQTQR